MGKSVAISELEQSYLSPGIARRKFGVMLSKSEEGRSIG